MTNRRRSDRFAVSLPVWLKDGLGGERSHTVDISAHGIAVATQKNRPIRQYVELELTLPDRATVSVTAMVARQAELLHHGVRVTGVGLNFFLLDAQAKTTWHQFLHTLRGKAPSGPVPVVPLAPKPPPPPPDDDLPTFIIKPRDLARLWSFFRGELTKSIVRIEAPVPKPIGTPVELLVVHPTSQAEWALEGKVARATAARGRAVLEIQLLHITPELKSSFRSYVTTGRGQIEEEIPLSTDFSSLLASADPLPRPIPRGEGPGGTSGLSMAALPERSDSRSAERIESVVIDLDQLDDLDLGPDLDGAPTHFTEPPNFDPEEEEDPTITPASPEPELKTLLEAQKALSPKPATALFAAFFAEAAGDSELPSQAATISKATEDSTAEADSISEQDDDTDSVVELAVGRSDPASFFEPRSAGNQSFELLSEAPVLEPGLVLADAPEVVSLLGGPLDSGLRIVARAELPPRTPSPRPAPPLLPPEEPILLTAPKSRSAPALPDPPAKRPPEPIVAHAAPEPVLREPAPLFVAEPAPKIEAFAEERQKIELRPEPQKTLKEPKKRPPPLPAPETRDTDPLDDLRVVRGAPLSVAPKRAIVETRPKERPPEPVSVPQPDAHLAQNPPVPPWSTFDFEEPAAEAQAAPIAPAASAPAAPEPAARPRVTPKKPSRNLVEADGDAAHLNVSTASDDPALARDIALARARMVRSPNSVTACYRLGMLLLRGGDDHLNEALTSLHKVMALEPNHPGAHHKLAEVLARRGEYVLAADHLNRARKMGYRIDPDLEQVVNEGARLLAAAD